MATKTLKEKLEAMDRKIAKQKAILEAAKKSIKTLEKEKENLVAKEILKPNNKELLEELMK